MVTELHLTRLRCYFYVLKSKVDDENPESLYEIKDWSHEAFTENDEDRNMCRIVEKCEKCCNDEEGHF